MHTKDSSTSTQEVEKKDVIVDIANSQAEHLVSEDTDSKKSVSDWADLFRVIIFPASKGPYVVAKHSARACPIAIAVYAIVKGFFVLCFYYGINQAILRAFVEFGYSIADGIKIMSEEMKRFVVNAVIFNISKIPIIGEPISQAANNYLSDYLTLLSTSISTETNDNLYNLYPAISLPEGIGFLMGITASLIGIILSALVLKLFLVIIKHPFKSFPEIFSLLAIRCVISIPIIFVIAIISIFLPMAGVVLLPLEILYGISYMFSVLFKSNNEISENRFVYTIPFVIILMLLVSVIATAIEGVGAGISIYVRLDAFFQTLQ